MAEFKVPGQALTFEIPDDGQLFRAAGTQLGENNTVYKRIGNTIYAWDSVRADPSGRGYVASTKFEDTYGPGSYMSIPTFNLGDVQQAWNKLGYSFQPVSDLNQFKPGGEVKASPDYTLNVSPVNPNGADITDSEGNVIKKSPSTQEVLSHAENSVASTDPNRVINQTTGQTAQQGNPISAPQPQSNPSNQTNASATISQLSAPTGNLKPGDTGESVKQLQDYLVSKGLLTQDQVNTGYGIYGPATTQAVAKLQQSLGVQAGSNAGYYGPLTMAAIQHSATTSGNQTGQNQTNNPATGTGLVFDNNYGVTQAQWTQMNDTQRALVAAAYTAKQSAYNSDGQQLTFADALAQAAKDPNIVAQFSDAAKLDAQTFAQNIQQLQQSFDTDAQTKQMQFENDRKTLAEQQAAKGAAYSGFRNLAQEQLGKTENGIVQSSRATLQQNLNNATQQFESKYGSAATNPALATFSDPFAGSNVSLSGQYSPTGGVPSTLTGTKAGDITGSQPIAKQNAINTKATSLYDLANFVPKTT